MPLIRHVVFKRLYIFFLLFFMPACMKKRVTQCAAMHHAIESNTLPNAHEDEIVVNLHDEETTRIKHLEARLPDIPIPLRAAPRAPYCQTTQSLERELITLGYVVNSSCDDLVALYTTQMECFGWRLESYVGVHNETILEFTRPLKKCFISLRPYEKQLADSSEPANCFLIIFFELSIDNTQAVN